MKVALVYITVTNGIKTFDFASRFASSYIDYPPLFPHDTVIVGNGGPPKNEVGLLFSPMKPKVWPRKNDNEWDISSAYIEASKTLCKDYDMMLCLGESNYFHKPGWLMRIVDAWQKNGPGMYGPYATNVVRAHLQTTAFCCPPALLANYPFQVTDKKSRYDFEHGERALWRITARRKIPVRLVTFDGDYLPQDWRKPKNILWRGDQSNCLDVVESC